MKEHCRTPGPILQRAFYERDTVTVARDLLGQILVQGQLAGRIVEVEAYVTQFEGQPDRAAHAFRGITPRTRVLFGPGGFAYVYLIYGIHQCLNISAEPAGEAGCVLIRALEPLTGIGPASGPGRLTRALGITLDDYGRDLTQPGGLCVRRGWRNEPIAASPRIGITHCADWPLRFYLAENVHVSHPGRISRTKVPSQTGLKSRLPLK